MSRNSSPGPFSWEEKGRKQIRKSKSPLLFLREEVKADKKI